MLCWGFQLPYPALNWTAQNLIRCWKIWRPMQEVLLKRKQEKRQGKLWFVWRIGIYDCLEFILSFFILTISKVKMIGCFPGFQAYSVMMLILCQECGRGRKILRRSRSKLVMRCFSLCSFFFKILCMPLYLMKIWFLWKFMIIDAGTKASIHIGSNTFGWTTR